MRGTSSIAGSLTPLPQNQTEPVIRVINTSKRFGRNPPTLCNLTFEVKEGQIFCLLGPSGSGKSTTMRMLTGVIRPSEGEVRVLGVDPLHFNRKIRREIGYMPQQFVLFPELSTLDNINFVASAYGMSWFGRAKKVREALEFVNLWEARHRLVSHLSGGMRRRLDLASTLVHGPRLIFVDEPTAGIDPVLRAKFWEHFKTLKEEGRTLFVTTQYVTEADYCDVVAILNRGRLLAIGTPEEVRRQAMGGEIVHLVLAETGGKAREILKSMKEVRQFRAITPLSFELTVDKASEALPLLMLAFQREGIGIRSIEPYRPDFEEVFVRLMEQDVPETEKETPARADTLKESVTKVTTTHPALNKTETPEGDSAEEVA